MANLTAPQQAIASRITAFNSPRMIRGQDPSFRSLAKDLGNMSRPDIVKIGVESIRTPGTDLDIEPSERLARLVCESDTLSKLKPGFTAWTWDQIGRNPEVSPIAFGKAISVFQERKADQILLNIDRVHRSWISMLESDNLMNEITALHDGVPKEVHGNAGNWLVWAALAKEGVQEPLTHQVHSFSRYLIGQLKSASTGLALFGNNYSNIPGIASQIKTLGRAVEKETRQILMSEASAEEKAYAKDVQASVHHAMDIAKAYMSYLPSEILVYSSRESDIQQNMPEAVDRLLEEEDPAASFLQILERAEKRRKCPSGEATVAKWHAFFSELTGRDDNAPDWLKASEKDPLVASYLTPK